MREMYKFDWSSERHILLVIFLACLTVRALFILLSGFDSFELASDTFRYHRQSDQILQGNFNLIEPLFITAPFYPYLMAFFKVVFQSNWIPALQIAQLLISSISGVFVFKIAKLVWDRVDVAFIAGMMFCLYPFTFWWVHTFSQEMVFQSLLVISVYFLIKTAFQGQLKSAILFAVTFPLAFLTKSHILIFAPFAAAFIMIAPLAELRRRAVLVGIIAIICFAFTLPYGLYNLRVNGVYTLSSTGQGGFFLTGHNDDVYKAIVDPPPLGSAEAQRLFSMEYTVFRDIEPQKEGLTHSEIQNLYLREGLRWVRENPRLTAELAVYNLYYYLMPGLNPNWYPRRTWLISLAVASPIYLLAYYGIASMLLRDLRRHFWILGLFATMVIFSVGFYGQNRFRTITIEPFYIIYAAFSTAYLLQTFKTNRKMSQSLVVGDDN